MAKRISNINKSKKQDSFVKISVDFFKSNIFLSFAVILTVAGAVVVSLLPPLVLADTVDLLTEGKGFSFGRGVLYFALIALTGLLESSRESLLTLFGQRFTHTVRTHMSEKLSRLPAATLNNLEPGATASRFVGDVDTVETLFTSGIISMIADACKIVSIFVIILFKNPGLGLILLLVLPLIFLYTRSVQNRMLSAHIANRVAVSRVTNHVPETLRCIRTVHSLGAEKHMKQTYDGYITESYRAVDRTNFYDAVYSPVIMIVNALVVAAVMLLSASGNQNILALFGMSVGASVAVINYITQIFGPIESLGMEIQTIQSAVAGVKRINEYLDLEEKPDTLTAGEYKALAAGNIPGSTLSPDSVECPVSAHSKPYKSAGVEIENLSFGYDVNIPVIKNLSFSVKPGEQVTLLGRTGAGKSTLFKLLLGMYPPTEGKITVNGIDACMIPESEKRHIFGYVEQNFHCIPGNILDQITLKDPCITIEMAENAAKTVGIDGVILSLEKGYETPCTPDVFSQGQWQLLSIARAVAADPGILLLDEITANLDADTEARVLQAISNVSVNRTVISISHRIFSHTGGRLINISGDGRDDD